VEKLLQKRIFEDDTKINEIRLSSANEITGLRGDLQEMKNVIHKLSNEEWNFKKEAEPPKIKEDFEMMCAGLRRKIDELRA
jgi:hypothetical protein